MKKLFLLLCLTLCTIFYGANLTNSAVVEATVSETAMMPTQKKKNRTIRVCGTKVNVKNIPRCASCLNVHNNCGVCKSSGKVFFCKKRGSSFQ